MSSLAIPKLSLFDSGGWKARWKVEKREGDWGHYLKAGLDHLVDEDPYEVIEREGNLLMNGGVSVIWEALKGQAVAGPNNVLAFFNNANARIGVGDSTTVVAATQNDLSAAANKLRNIMDATYPLHTDGVVTASQIITYRSSFATAEANWIWNEWGVFNGLTLATSRMLNRKVEPLGTKVSGTWTLTVDITIA